MIAWNSSVYNPLSSPHTHLFPLYMYYWKWCL